MIDVVDSLMFLIGGKFIFGLHLRLHTALDTLNMHLECRVIASLAALNGTRYGQMYMFAMNEMPLPGFASRTMPISASIVASVYQVSLWIGSKSSTSALYPPKFPMAVCWFCLIYS